MISVLANAHFMLALCQALPAALDRLRARWILMPARGGGCCSHAHFTDEEIEAVWFCDCSWEGAELGYRIGQHDYGTVTPHHAWLCLLSLARS